MKRAKLIACGAFIGVILSWLAVIVAGALSDGPGSPALERVLKK